MKSRKSRYFLVYYIIYLVTVWSIFRYFVRLPEVVEELMFKPLIWLSPLWWWRLSQGKEYKLIEGRWGGTVVWGFGGGLILFVLFRLLLGNSLIPVLNLERVALTSSIAIVQGLAFFGGVMTIAQKTIKKGYWSEILTGLVMGTVQVPIGIFVNKLTPVLLIGTFLITFFVGVIVGNLKTKSKSTLTAILAYWFFLLAVL